MSKFVKFKIVFSSFYDFSNLASRLTAFANRFNISEDEAELIVYVPTPDDLRCIFQHPNLDEYYFDRLVHEIRFFSGNDDDINGLKKDLGLSRTRVCETIMDKPDFIEHFTLRVNGKKYTGSDLMNFKII